MKGSKQLTETILSKNYPWNPAVNVDPVLAGTENDKRMSCCIVSRPDNPTKEKLILSWFNISCRVRYRRKFADTAGKLAHDPFEVAHSRPRKRSNPLYILWNQKMEAINSITVKGPVLNTHYCSFDANAVALSFTSSYPTHTKLRWKSLRLCYSSWSWHSTTLRRSICSYPSLQEQLSTEDVKHMLKTIRIHKQVHAKTTSGKLHRHHFFIGHYLVRPTGHLRSVAGPFSAWYTHAPQRLSDPVQCCLTIPPYPKHTMVNQRTPSQHNSTLFILHCYP